MLDRSARAAHRARRGGSGFSRESNLTRGLGTREERRSVLIITNGESTEVVYFDALRTEPWVTADKVRVRFEAGAPTAIVDRAARIRNDSGYDEAWVVCDAGEFDIRSAISQARRHTVELTVSVPCFEVWLVLHLATGCPGFNTAAQVEDHLKKLLSRWGKTALRFADFRDGVFDAVTRAKRLDSPPEGNPSTDVWRLIEALQAAPEAQK